MIDRMPRKLPLYCHRETTRHGKPVIYYRVNSGPRIRLPADPTTDEFKAAYLAAATGQPIATIAASSDTLEWLIDRYRESAHWQNLGAGTRAQRNRVFKKSINLSGRVQFKKLTPAIMESSFNGRASVPSSANLFLTTMRALFVWAKKDGHIEADPTKDIKMITIKTDGYRPWAIEDVISFRAYHTEGTVPRLALELLLVTGLRRSDLVAIGFQHMRGAVLSLRTQKTGTEVSIEFPQYLVDLIEITPTCDLQFLRNGHGHPFKPSGFSSWFERRCKEAGVTKSAHGLRKLSATLAAEGGAPAHQIMAQYGWETIAQAERYTKKAERKRLGVDGSRVVAEQIENRIPRTLNEVRRSERKIK